MQEAWIRWQGVDHDSIESPAAYLTTVVTRLALDRTRTIARRREEYLGPWLPEPIAIEREPREHSEMAQSLTLGFLMLLDRLNPTERAVWLLADVFATPYALISEATGKSEPACRQIATRARRRLREERPATPERLDAALLGQRWLPWRRATSPRRSSCSMPTSCSRATAVPDTRPHAIPSWVRIGSLASPSTSPAAAR